MSGNAFPGNASEWYPSLFNLDADASVFLLIGICFWMGFSIGGAIAFRKTWKRYHPVNVRRRFAGRLSEAKMEIARLRGES